MSKEFRVGDEVEMMVGRYVSLRPPEFAEIILIDDGLHLPIVVRWRAEIHCFAMDGTGDEHSILYKPQPPKTEKRWARIARVYDNNGAPFLKVFEYKIPVLASDSDTAALDWRSDPLQIEFTLYPEGE